MLDPKLDLVQKRLHDLEEKRDMETAKSVILAVVGILLPETEGLKFRLFRDGDGKLTANASWFFLDDEFADRRATYVLDLPDETNLDVKVYGVSKPSMQTISWVVGLTPNFEDEPFNSVFNVGIDFVIPAAKDRIILALSKNHVIRTIELKGHLTATFLEILANWTEIKDTSRKAELHDMLWNSLDLHPINRRFYEGISQRFINLRQHLENSNVLDSHHAAQFANRLIGRVIFTWFLDKKQLLNEGSRYFESSDFANDTDYYKQRLEPLFFEVLNVPVPDRTSDDLSTPYLNGGLFEAKQGDLNKSETLNFPQGYFDDFLGFLRGYNFTTDESTSEFQQVAIDPEMLGRIFENLLAEVNEETGEQARKAKGAFYTPRQVVDFMCKEALRGYIKTRIPQDDQLDRRLYQLIDAPEREFQDQDHNWRRDLKPYKEQLVSILDGLRIIDPACGSGAFPIGMLQLLVKVYSRLEARFDAHRTKLSIIEKNLYGVDIEPMAVEISRLRAWLALVVDETSSVGTVKPLPNLDFKFVCANSLLYLDNSSQIALFEDHELDVKLQEIREAYFSTQSLTKKTRLKSKYSDLVDQELTLFGETKRTSQLKSFRPFEADSVTAFFDPMQMFGVENFHIVIGNPPYVNIEKVDKAVKSEISRYKTAYQKYDLYVLFYERGLEILCENGILSFITSNKFLTQNYGLLLRKELLRQKILSLVNFNVNIFDSASVATCVMNLQKGHLPGNQIKFLEINSKEDARNFTAGEFAQIDQDLFDSLEDKTFRPNLDSAKLDVVKRIRGDHPLLGEICFVSYGLRANHKDGSAKKKDIVFSEPGDGRKPYFEGKDIRYWGVNQSGFIQYEPEKMYNPMFEELFSEPKLVGSSVFAELSKLRFGFENKGMICSHTAIVVIPWASLEGANHSSVKKGISTEIVEKSKSFDIRYIQAILNSLVTKFYFSETMWDRIHFYPNQMKAIPVPAASTEAQVSLADLATNLYDAEAGGNSATVSRLRSELDHQVMKIFGLSDTESKAIRSWLPDLQWN